MSNLINNGVPLLSSLKLITRGTTNRYVKEPSRNRGARCGRRHNSLARSMEKSGAFPASLVDRIAIGEQTGELGKAFAKAASKYDEDLDVRINRLTSLVPQAILVDHGRGRRRGGLFHHDNDLRIDVRIQGQLKNAASLQFLHFIPITEFTDQNHEIASPIKLRKTSTQRGFTLVELVIVLTIIGILAGSGIYMLIGWLDEAKFERVRGDINTIDLAIKGYERGNYSKPPTEEQGLMALVERPTSDPQPERWRAYLEDAKALLDPWGNPYQYRYPAQKSKKKYDIWSLGEDGVESEDDTGNW